MHSPLPEQFDRVDMSDLYARYPALREVETTVDHRLPGRRQIVDLLPRNGVGAEIGVFTAVSSEFLIHKTKPRRISLVDPWSKLHGPFFPASAYFGGGRLATAAGFEAARLRARVCPASEVVEAFSLDWIRTVPVNSLDWVYLDTSHRYEDTLAELKALASKMTAKGVIAGDDGWTRRDSPHIGVFRAARDFCQSAPYELFRLDHAGQWALRRRID